MRRKFPGAPVKGRAITRPLGWALQKFSRDIADAIKLCDRDYVFVGRHLKDAVAGGVDDGVAGAMCFAPSSFMISVPEAGLLARVRRPIGVRIRRSASWRKTVRDRPGRLIEPDAGHFPVAGGGVFSGRARGAFAVAAGWMRGRSEMVERFDVREAEAD